MAEFDINYQNYDKVFKSSFSIFKNEIIDFLGVDLPKIDAFLETEFSEIETSEERLDLNFKLEDSSILHLEEEADISRKDLIRFASYDLKLYNRYQDKIRTVILCVNGFQDSKVKLDIGSLRYSATVIDMSKRDGNSKIKEIKRKIKEDEEVNVLELIFLPLMDSREKMVDRVKKAIDLEQELELPVDKASKVVAMTLVIADKFLSDREISEIWRDYKMLRILKFAEEKGKERGIEEGRKEEMERMALKLLINKFGGLSKEYKKKLKEQDKEELEVIIDKIFDLKDVTELKKYLN
jgi:hypothetical protein